MVCCAVKVCAVERKACPDVSVLSITYQLEARELYLNRIAPFWLMPVGAPTMVAPLPVHVMVVTACVEKIRIS